MADAIERLLRRAEQGIAGAYSPDEMRAKFYVCLRAILCCDLPEPQRQLVTQLCNVVAGAATDRTDVPYDVVHRCRTLASALRTSGQRELANVSAMFAIAFEESREDPPPDSYCSFTLMDIECNHCSAVCNYFFWTIINTLRRPDLYNSCAEGDILRPRCMLCDAPLDVSVPFFYCDPSRDDYLLFGVPYHQEAIRAHFHEYVSGYLEAIPPRFRGEKTRVAFVSTYMPGAWSGADDVNLVFHVSDPAQFNEIIKADIWEWMIRGEKLLRRPDLLPSQIHHLFDERQFGTAIHQWCESFLLDPKQHKVLRDIAAALLELGQPEPAAQLQAAATLLRQKLLSVGAIDVRRENWPHTASSTHLQWALQIDAHGLPDEWSFQDLVRTIEELRQQFTPPPV